MSKTIQTIFFSITIIIFLSLFIFHLNSSNAQINHFKVEKRELSDLGTVKILKNDVDEPLNAFVEDFNNFIDDELNPSIKTQNTAALVGYAVAILLSGFSIFLVWSEKLK